MQYGLKVGFNSAVNVWQRISFVIPPSGISRSIATIVQENVVIGSGPAGMAYAREARRLGKSVAIIDTKEGLGGVSLTTGTLPSKTKWALAKIEYQHGLKKTLEYSDRIQEMIDKEQKRLSQELEEHEIQYIPGIAKFENPKEIRVYDERTQKGTVITADRFFIATGSTPRIPADVPFDGTQVFNSSQIVKMKGVPRSITIVGAGVIGSEYANIFAARGVKVSLIDRNLRILTFVDKDLTKRLLNIWSSRENFSYFPNADIRLIDKSTEGVRVILENGKTITSDVMLYAQGRVANIEALHLDAAGVELSERRFIRVNDLFQTTVPSIYAGGDVIGPPSLASTSWRQGHIAARYAWGKATQPFPSHYPTGIFTIPEIAYCGETEESLQASGKRYKVGVADYSTLGRSIITDGREGLVKILFEPDSEQIYGVHIIGEGACEAIHYAKVAMDLKAPVSYFYKEISNYPTFSGEGLRNAALQGKKGL